MKKLRQYLVVVTIIFSAQLLAKKSMVYSGSYEAQIKTVVSANKVKMLVSVWPGFDRFFEVTLPNIDVPEMYEEAPSCHIKLMNDAKKYTQKFLRNSERVELRGIKMEDSTSENATSNIYNEETTLSDELLKKGYARSNSIAKDVVWCVDEE